MISISHAVAKGVRKPPGALHLCYCLTPMRYAWDLRDAYLAASAAGSSARSSNRVLDRLRKWDRASAIGVDRFAGISRYVVERIGASYGREAEVVYPPVDVDYFSPGPPPDGPRGYFLTASRWVPYKRIDAIVAAFGALPGRRLIVTGDGPDAARIRAAAGPNVEFAGEVSRDRLRALMRGARAFVFAAEEDFGIVPLEAQACGTPVIAYARGAATETLRAAASAPPTAVFFTAQDRRRSRRRSSRSKHYPRPSSRRHAARMPSASRRRAFVASSPRLSLAHGMNTRSVSDNRAMAPSLLKPHASLFAALLRALDPAVALAAGAAAFGLYRPELASAEHYVLFVVAGAVTIVALFPAFGLYDPQRGASLADELRDLLLAWLAIAALAAGALFVTRSGQAFSRVWVASWLAGGFVATSAMRIALRIALRVVRSRGHNLRHIAIVGAGALGFRVAVRLAEAAWTGFKVAAFYDDDVAKHGTWVAGCRVAGRPESLAADIKAGAIDQVWIALPLRAEVRVREILTLLREHAVDIRFVPDIFGFHLLNHSLTEVAGLPVLSLTASPMTGSARLTKALEDYVLGTIGFVFALPLMALIALGIKLTSPGPGAVPSGAGHLERRRLRNAQVPHDAGGCRTREWARLVAQGRNARDSVRCAATPPVA